MNTQHAHIYSLVPPKKKTVQVKNARNALLPCTIEQANANRDVFAQVKNINFLDCFQRNFAFIFRSHNAKN